MNDALHLLVVDDDPDMRQLLNDALSSFGYAVHAVATGRELHNALARLPIRLLILDLRLEHEDGLSLAREVRQTSEVPIIMLTGKGDETDRILSLELAADDFLMKPFNIRELLARVHALLRRSGGSRDNGAATGAGKRLKFGDWILDLEHRELNDSTGKRKNLTYAEFNLLEAFAQAPSRIWTRDQLLEVTRGLDATVYDRTVDVLILRLRRKIEPNPRQPRYIRTERGIGYLFSAHVIELA